LRLLACPRDRSDDGGGLQVVNHSTSPEWQQGFAWAFDTPPKGQKLHISCKSKSAFGKVSGDLQYNKPLNYL
jgi:hypothetical protein